MSLRTDFKDEIPAGGSRKYGLVDNSGNYLYKDVKIVRTNENVQDGDEFGAAEVNTIHEYLNLMHNDNLLINGDFQINQRGQNEYSVTNSDLFTLDRWRIIGANATAKLTKLNNGVRLQNADTGSVVLTQRIYIEKVSNYTIVINAKNVVGNVVVEIYDMGSGYEIHNLKNGRNVFKVTNQSLKDITPTIVGAGSIEIEYVDLYEGDIAYQHIKEDPAIALLRCQQYYFSGDIMVPILYEYGNGPYQYLVNISYAEMRTLPTVVSNICFYHDASGNNIETIATDINVSRKSIKIRTPGGVRRNTNCFGMCVRIVLDAEIH